MKSQAPNLLMTELLTLIKDSEPSPKIFEKEEVNKSIYKYPFLWTKIPLLKKQPKTPTLASFIWMPWHSEWELVVFKVKKIN
jgi:hypothetical protein